MRTATLAPGEQVPHNQSAREGS